MNSSENLFYSENTITLIKTAGEYCSLMEECNNYSLKELIGKLLISLPHLYHLAISIPDLDESSDSYNEKFVTEELYNNIHYSLLTKFGQYDSFEGLYIEENFQNAEKTTMSISEFLSDIYQDLKNFIYLFQFGNEEVMYEALWELKVNFELYWGKRIAELMRPLHDLYFSEKELEEDTFKKLENKRDTTNWFISKRQHDFQNGLN